MRRLDRTLRRGSPAPVSLASRALSAIRRNGGTLLLPGAATPNGDGTFSHGNPPLRNYLDSAGTDLLDSVTQVDQPVGLCLDSMGVVGPNVFSDASVVFGGETTRVSPGVYRVYSSAGVFSNLTQTGNGMQANKTYRLRFNVDSVVSGSLAVDGPSGNVVPTVSAGVGMKECFVTMAATATISIKRPSGVTDIQISNVTIEEIPGNHATQPTTASKPLLRRGLVNQLLNNQLGGGGTAPTGWLSFGAGGAEGALLPSGMRQRVFTSTASRDFIYVVHAVAANTVYTVAVYVDANPNNANAPNIVNQGSMPAGSAWTVPDVVPADGSFVLATLTVGATAGSITLRVGLGTSSNITGSVTLSAPAIFQGTVTADQILAAGGIPLTSAVPASSAIGRWHWASDANDTLGLTLPAGFNAATTIDARSTGHVTMQNQNIVGAYSIGPSITSFGRTILPSSPSASDLALLQRYANWLAGL